MTKDEIIESINCIKPESVRVIAVDLDNTLCQGVAWKPEDIDKLEVDQEIAGAINELFIGNYIVIHTARRRELALETLSWLDKKGIRYHAIRFEKMPATIYIDDKSINPFKEKHKEGEGKT